MDIFCIKTEQTLTFVRFFDILSFVFNPLGNCEDIRSFIPANFGRVGFFLGGKNGVLQQGEAGVSGAACQEVLDAEDPQQGRGEDAALWLGSSGHALSSASGTSRRSDGSYRPDVQVRSGSGAALVLILSPFIPHFSAHTRRRIQKV